MRRFTIFVGLSLVFLLLSACQASGVEGSPVKATETLPSPTSTDITEVPKSPIPLTKTTLPAILYVVENTLVKQAGNGSPEILADFPVANQVAAAALSNQHLFVLDEQGITQVNLADGSYERLMNFDKPAKAGQLIIFDQGSKIVYSTVIEDLTTPSSFATVVGAIELEHKTELFRSYLTTRVGLLGLTKDENDLLLRPFGQDPEFDRILLLDLSKSDEAKEVPLQGVAVSIASLSPNTQFLATMAQIPGTGDPTDLEAVLSLYDLSSLDLPTHRDIALPNSPSYFREVLWSSDSQKAYFLLLPGKSWEEPSTSYGLWSLDASTEEMSQVASISDVDFALSRISSDGEWILLTRLSKDGATLVHLSTGESQSFDIPQGALTVEMLP